MAAATADGGPSGSTARTDLLVGVAAGVLTTVVAGLVAWGFGLGQSVGDLDTRTTARQATLQKAIQVSARNADQIGANAQQITQLSHSVDLLRSAVDALVRDSAEQRQANREDLRELRSLIRELMIRQSPADTAPRRDGEVVPRLSPGAPSSGSG